MEPFFDPAQFDKEKLKAFGFEDGVDIFQDSILVQALYPLLGVLFGETFGFQFKRWKKQVLLSFFVFIVRCDFVVIFGLCKRFQRLLIQLLLLPPLMPLLFKLL